jgi:alpha-amylase/alpha-mannosidase (GH57 family)
MKKFVPILILLTFFQSLSLATSNFSNQGSEKDANTNPPIYIAFLWHMHQPIYFPYESIVQTQLNNRYPYSVFDIHNQRWGPYTSWPKNAVSKGITANLPHFGAQVSFSGSLVENLNNLENYGNGNFTNWKSHWNSIKNQKTSLNNPRLDLVAFGYFHPLMGLIDYTDIRKQNFYAS